MFLLKTIQASNDQKAYALVDNDIYETIQKMGLKFRVQPNRYFRSATEIQFPGMIKKKCLLLHRLVFILKTGEEPSLTVDHIDRNPANNQILNLRLATRQQQQHNKGKSKNNTSGYIGVCRQCKTYNTSKEYVYWQSSIHKQDGHRETKTFPYTDEGKIAAAHWYDAKAIEYYGNFAVLNFPDE